MTHSSIVPTFTTKTQDEKNVADHQQRLLKVKTLRYAWRQSDRRKQLLSFSMRCPSLPAERGKWKRGLALAVDEEANMRHQMVYEETKGGC